ncbi:hypothetical protein EYZ11_004318 [Aspergillus tanneri]|uniref:Mediator of RNA polymerase II transcription subunit 4 n=1 Tax=Aspergillus tanneri TaxID=1220188 RepID=A0A4S3JKT1_9EURO|nr:uncharacterized protein ATNIH1004_002280 [Aspergillus tanneri]KAA8649609.1 hypothetical protein ATNIH1004_002280 [Aspergillus tanneri]THC96199.1 hypothetical protein EYZ11_004318 [Aspergillus tanneri]
MNAQFQATLSDFEAKLNALIVSLTTSPTAAGAPAAALNLLDADDSLTSAVDTLRTHQANYAKILQLRAEAESLEERVKTIVRDIVSYEKDIQTACGHSDDSESESDDSSDGPDEDNDDAMLGRKSELRRTKEIDYRILLDFARRISKYNHQAAADAAEGINEAKARKKIEQGHDHDMDMSGVNGADTDPAEPVSSVTKDATFWLDESANMTRQIYMLPYPTEDRIRMGLMGQIQLAAAEGGSSLDPDQEVERLIREAEGFGVAKAAAHVHPGEDTQHADMAAKAAAHAGSMANSGGRSGAPPPKPKATLDLDLYDPEDDDV